MELERKNAELRQLSARLLQIQDEERKRIARDLHDSTGQSLAILAMNLEQLRVKTENISPSLAATVSDTREIVDKIITELRTISYLLHPPLLDELGLASALRWYADGLAERSELKINLDLDNTLGRLPADLETALFRVVQECLTNIHRHAASPTATIGLRVSSGNIVLEVADTGTGMSPEKLAKTAAGGLPGVGLRGMRERIEGFNGKLEILSGKEGTTIKILIPLDSLQASA